MEEDAYRATYHEINKTRCAFEKTILSRRYSCQHAHKFCLADREGVTCQNQNRQLRCQDFLGLIRQKAQFSLKLPLPGEKLPHAREMRLQLGSLSGLSTALEADHATKIEDISHLLSQAKKHYTNFDALPFDLLVRTISHQATRSKRPRKTS